MPHLVISYAKPLEEKVEIQKLVQAVWDSANATGLFNPEAIKARAFPVEHYLTANTDKTFVHVDAKIFPGRTDEQKQGLVKSIFEAITSVAGSDVSISAEAIDIDKPNYIKN